MRQRCYERLWWAGLCSALLLALRPSPVLAWGASAHRITGEIATALLRPESRARLRELVGSDDLSLVATYMDDERPALALQHPGSPAWHYDNRPVCAPDTPYGQYCPEGQCATAQVEAWYRVLANSTAPADARAFAVKLLVHVVADLHQPLHAADNADRGGNEIEVRLPGRARAARLHAVWDTELVKIATRGHSERAYAAGLLAQYAGQIPAWQQGSAQDWAAESYQLARTVVYQPVPGYACDWHVEGAIELPEAYVRGALAIIPGQLTRAGARIAFLLNSALAGAQYQGVPAGRLSGE